MDKQVMAKCPKCGFWMLISARVQDATVAPTSMCTDRAGWNHCQTLNRPSQKRVPPYVESALIA